MLGCLILNCPKKARVACLRDDLKMCRREHQSLKGLKVCFLSMDFSNIKSQI